MVNKRGYMRVVEASIAVLIVLGVVLAVSSETRVGEDVDLTRITSPLLEELGKDARLREKIFQSEDAAESDINIFLEDRIGSSLGHEGVICGDIESVCSCPVGGYPDNAEGGIFSEERIISTHLNENSFSIDSAKKIKICVWRLKS